jgi:hypothetical protein
MPLRTSVQFTRESSNPQRSMSRQERSATACVVKVPIRNYVIP